MAVTTVSAKLLEPVLQLAKHYRQPTGQDLQQSILEIAALSGHEFTKPGARFPASHYPKVLDKLSEISGNPLIALHLGEATQPRMLGSIGFLMSTAPTLEQAYQTLIDYLPLLFEGAVMQMEQTVDGTVLTLELNDNDPHAIEYFLACLINWPRWLIGRQVPALAVQLTLPEPDNIQPYQQFFAAEVEFDAARNQLLLSSDYLQLACVDANSEMHHLHREFADSLLSKASLQNALTAQTRNLIRQQLAEGGGSVRREQIAESVGLSLRTLQRKLGQQGSNFQEIYDQTRREVCLQLIQRGQLSFGEISFQLGFSNQSAFQKAFKRWMGIAPSEYRQQVKPLEIDSVTATANPVQNTHWLKSPDRAEMLSRKLSGLSRFSLELLERAAIIGERFDLNQLAEVTGNPLARLAIHFWPAEQAGLVIALQSSEDQTQYRFADLDLWQQIYQEITQNDRQRLHSDYAHFLIANLPRSAGLEQIANLLFHLQEIGLDRINRELETAYLRLSLRASDLARKQQDYATASRYMATACELPIIKGLPDSTERRMQCANLYLLAGHIHDAQKQLDLLEQQTLSRSDKGRAALMTTRLLQHQSRHEEALEYLLVQLARIDRALPSQSNEQLALLLTQLTYISDAFSAQALTEMKELTDSSQYARLQLLEQIALLARQQSKPLLAACAIGRMTELSLRYGRTPLTPFAFVSYAWVASWFCADFSLAQTFSAQGMQLANRYGGLIQENENTDSATSAALLHCSQVQHWFSPLRAVQEQLQQLDHLTSQHGQWLLQSESRLLLAQLNLFSTTDLKTQRDELIQQHAQMISQHQAYSADCLQTSALNLIDQLTAEHRITSVEYQHGWQAVSTIITALLLDQQHLWHSFYHWESQLENELAGYFGVSEALFCTALMRLIQAQQQGAISKRRRLEVEQLESRLEIWARHCPANFNGQLFLLRAEKARLDGQLAGRYFEQALAATGEQPFGFHKALIYERYAEYLSAYDQPSLARFCFNEARWFYEKWGADTKVKQLVQRLALLAK